MKKFSAVLIFFSLLLASVSFSQTPNACNEYTSVGTTSSPYGAGTNVACNALVPGVVTGTGAWTGSGCAGFITSTVTGPPVTCLTVSYAYVNTNDYGVMTTNNGGVLTVTAVNCGVVGTTVGPYNCPQAFPYGNVSVTVCSTIPFTTLTLTNTGCTSGWVINCVQQTVICDPGWTLPTPCSDDPLVDLSALVTGDTGGTWTGTGVTGVMFDPSAGSSNVTYTAPCGDILAQMINVTPAGNPAWAPPAGICSNGPIIDLTTLVTGTVGGAWTGTGVTGNNFDPSVGTQNLTYTAGTSPCDNASVQAITVIPALDPTWVSPGTICEAAGTVNLDGLLTGDVGGVWSGSGVTGSTFDPTGLSGAIAVTYTIGVVPCVGVDMQNITVNPDVDPAWTAPTTLCDDSSPFDLNTALSGTTGGTWSGTGVTGNMFDPAVGSQTVTYTVGIAPCDEFSALLINVGVAPNPAWTTMTMCAADAPVNLTGQITGDVGGTWTGTGMSGSVFDPFFGTQSITYTVSAGTCTSLSTQTVTVLDPQLVVSGTNISCFSLTDGSLDVIVSGGSGTYVYAWNTVPAQSTSTATNVGAGTYTITVTDGACVAIDSVTIIEPAEITASMTRVDACAPSLGAASIVAAGGVGGFTYTWNYSTLTAATATDLDSNMHVVTVTDANGCIYVDSILVQIFQVPIVTITADTTIEYGNELQLNASGGISYSWDPMDNLSCGNCSNPIADPLQDTYYCATVIDANGCTNEACVLVKVIIVCGDVFVPSAFSPNEDGENDILCVYSDCMEYLTFAVFNRWGEKVYETNNMNICWDGTWKGKLLNPAVFVYTLEGSLINGELVQQKGNISLVR